MIHLDVRGTRVPALGFGTWQLTGSACARMVRTALEIGYRHVDTAAMYDNEEAVGEALRSPGIPREELFVVTKVWSSDLARDRLLRSANASLRKLGLDRVDLLLIHWPSPSVPLGETLGAMRELQEQGKVGHIGVSNFSAALMREAEEQHGIEVFANQVPYHPFTRQDDVLAMCRERRIMLTAYTPIKSAARDRTLAEIGRRHGKSAPQVALRWLVEQDMVSAIPRSSNPEHARANYDIFDFALSDEEKTRIAALAR